MKRQQKNIKKMPLDGQNCCVKKTKRNALNFRDTFYINYYLTGMMHSHFSSIYDFKSINLLNFFLYTET